MVVQHRVQVVQVGMAPLNMKQLPRMRGRLEREASRHHQHIGQLVDLGLIDTYTGLILPLIASATATLLFRQFFLTVPDELVEAARVDGAGPMRFFWDVLLPMSRTSIAALFVIQFIYGWNQYLWPLLVTTNEDMYPIVLGIKRLVSGESYTEWNVLMATAFLAMLPPAIVVIFMQKWFVKGLVDTEK